MDRTSHSRVAGEEKHYSNFTRWDHLEVVFYLRSGAESDRLRANIKYILRHSNLVTLAIGPGNCPILSGFCRVQIEGGI